MGERACLDERAGEQLCEAERGVRVERGLGEARRLGAKRDGRVLLGARDLVHHEPAHTPALPRRLTRARVCPVQRHKRRRVLDAERHHVTALLTAADAA